MKLEGLVEKGAMCIFYSFEKIKFKVKIAVKNSVFKQTGWYVAVYENKKGGVMMENILMITSLEMG